MSDSDEDFCPEEKEESAEDSDSDSDEELEENEFERMSKRTRKSVEINVEQNELESDEKYKKKVDDLYKDFLSDVIPQTSSKSAAEEKDSKCAGKNEETKITFLKSNFGLSKINNNISSPTEENENDDKSNLQFPESVKGKRAIGSVGLSAVVNATQKKKKKTILEASLHDWKTFKQ